MSEDLSKVVYYCDSGYVIRLDGEEYRSFGRRCLKHGQWEGHNTPICTSKLQILSIREREIVRFNRRKTDPISASMRTCEFFSNNFLAQEN